MRRDVYIQNDSGGFSVVAHDALDAIIEDERSDDFRFVTSFKAMLLLLYGDDSMPVRLVVDEPLTRDEEEQWLAKATWRIDATDGRLLVMGGFDPDVMAWWKNETGGTGDGRGVALVSVPSGSLRVDVYAHVGSVNGRRILSEAGEAIGAAFRHHHSGRPFPLWLAHMLDHDDRDPGFDALWKNVKESHESGQLAIDTEGAAAIGFLVHVQRLAGPVGDAPEGGWFPIDANARVPATFPLGLPSAAADPDIDAFRDRLLGRTAPSPPPPIVTKKPDIIAAWEGDPLQAIRGNTAALAIRPGDAFRLYWIAALTADSPPSFELWIAPHGEWPAPASTSEYAVESKPSLTAIGPSPDNGGWWLWWAARSASLAIAGVPDGSTIDFAMAPRADANSDEDFKPAIGRARYRGTVRHGQWELAEASPAIDQATLADAIHFVTALIANEQILVRGDAELAAFESAAAIYSPEEESLSWDGDAVRLNAPEERTLLLLATPVFRARFGNQWPCDVEEPW